MANETKAIAKLREEIAQIACVLKDTKYECASCAGKIGCVHEDATRRADAILARLQAAGMVLLTAEEAQRMSMGAWAANCNCERCAPISAKLAALATAGEKEE